MNKMEELRLAKGHSKSALARQAGLNQVTVIEATNGRRPYRSQLERIAAALGWKGDPEELLREVGQNAEH